MLDKIISKTKGNGKKAVYVWFGGIIFGLLFTLLIWNLGPNLNHFIVTFHHFREVYGTTGNFQPGTSGQWPLYGHFTCQINF